MASACSIRVRGVVQGVGFRPFVYRLACANTLAGWVLNGEQGVEIHLEGAEHALDAFVHDLKDHPPAAASISEIEIVPAELVGLQDFTIRESERREQPTVRISPDLPVCEECRQELFDSENPRYLYPYINCTNCGPRYSVVHSLPYDRCNTTMKGWPLDPYCDAEYHSPSNRRFHAQPVACPRCGPTFVLRDGSSILAAGVAAIEQSALLLRSGKILAVKGLGGYHLACDARNAVSVAALRERKFRKEKPFAVMVRDLDIARNLADLSTESEALLTSIARPIVLAPARMNLEGVAPGNNELGLMLPYTPLHHLLFAVWAPAVLVMTSANRSSEPIAYEDDQALERLAGIADAFLIGERPIARRVDDSVARVGTFGPTILRRSRGYAPGAVATLPVERPILAVGPDLKNTITLVVGGQAFVSQHVGDLSHYDAYRAFQETVHDLTSMYEVSANDLLVVHDCHPQYLSTAHAWEYPGEKRGVQHHRAHIASVLAEREAWENRVLGISLDGTGYGDDATIWGGEIFVGSIAEGFERVAHLRPAALPGGDAAAQHPVQAAAGFLAQTEGLPDLMDTPFNFPQRYQESAELVRKDVRTFTTTSVGRLFDAAAALLGFTRPITFEGQAAIWLAQQARTSPVVDPYPFPFVDRELDFRPLLESVAADRQRGRNRAKIARAFHRGIAKGLRDAALQVCAENEVDAIVLSGGVFQNELLLAELRTLLTSEPVKIWVNHRVPPNDGGISLGQAALAAFSQFNDGRR
ncbi:MAG TPA: carbamoyltransferase HypF [Terriglobales bacterium]|nr:carbamoyltransferase HypF [Terriglobales bacterium]